MRKRKKFWIIFLLIGIVFLTSGALIETVAKSGICNNYIFVGDSRTVGMSRVVDTSDMDSCYFVAKSKMGLDWLKSTAIIEVQQILDNNPGKKFNIIFNLGVNDLYNVSKYQSIYNDLAQRWKGQNFYYVTVNPAIEETMLELGYKHRTDKAIQEFNKKIASGLDSSFAIIDTYSVLRYESGYSTIDGLHYTQPTYRQIFELVVDGVKRLQR